MDYEAALHVLSSSADSRSLKALESFLEANIEQLKRCDKPPTGPLRAPRAAGVGTAQSTAVDAESVASRGKISREAAEFAKAQALGGESVDEIITIASNAHRSVVKLVTELIKRYDETEAEDSQKQNLVNKVVPRLLADDAFFPRIFAAIGAGTLPDSVLTALLDLVFTSLFYVIPDSSLLIVDWAETVSRNSAAFANFSPENRRRGLLIALQFLNVHQDFSFANPGFSYFKDGSALVSLHTAFSSAPPAVSLVWALVLHAVALRYSERPDKSLSGLLEACRAKGGDDLATRSGQLLEQALARNALADLVDLATQTGPELTPNQMVSQTVADVLQALCRCVYVSHDLAKAIDVVLAPWPVLARAFFADDFVATTVELAKAKVPAALPTFVHLSRAIGPAANELVANMGSFIDEIDASQLDIVGDKATARLPLTLLAPRVSDGQGAIVLPVHSEGQVLGGNNQRPLVMWNFQYNGWSLLARVLEGSADPNMCIQSDPLDIVQLITSVLKSLDQNAADRLLGSLSASLARGDIIELLATRLENAMGDFDHVVECEVLLRFFTALTPVLPDRVWTHLARSRLLEQRGDAGFVATVVGGVEIFATRYDLTLAVVDLIEALLANFDSTSDLQTKVLSKLLSHLINVFESLPYWSYADSRQRRALLVNIVGVFSTVVESIQGSLADLLLTQLLAAGASAERAIQPLLNALADAEDTSFFTFSTWLVRARSARNMPYSLLERKLYDAAPGLVAIYCRHPRLRASVLEVFEALVAAGGPDQPSLLAYLGAGSSQLLLDALVQTAQSELELDDVLIALSKLFAAVARSQQEGLMILLASGKDVQNGSIKESSATRTTVLSALESLAVRNLSPEVLANVLECLAEGNSTNEGVAKRAVELVNDAFSASFLPTVDGAYRVLVVARALQILATLTFREHKSAAVESFTKSLTPQRLTNFAERVFTVNGFDADLHEYVHSQFVKIQPAPQPIFPRTYGPDFTYSLAHLDRCLRGKAEWAALRPRIAEANINLSFISAQTELVRYWRAWCMAALARGDLTSELAAVAEVALQADLADLAVPYFTAGCEMRIELAFFILHRLHNANKLTPSIDVLQESLRLLSGQALGVHAAVTSSSSLRTYKYLLRIVNLELTLFASDKAKLTDAKLTELTLALLDRVVICDARVIAAQTTAASASSTADIFVEIILCLRQSLTLLSAGPAALQQLLQSMLDCGTDRAVARIYSYALELQPEDPVLGELALLYFLEWLPLSIMADHFVANGLLAVLLEAPLSREIQAGNVVASVRPRLHSAWQRGLLMLMLMLLQQLGSRVVPEAVLFIESFEPQIDTCWQQWIQPSGEISIALIGETFLISMLLASLASHGRQDALARVLPKNELLQAIDHLSSHRKYLATRVAAPEDSLDVIVEEMADLRNVISQR